MYKVFFLQPPSPPFKDVDREFTAGLGQASDARRATWGHSRYPFFNHSLAWTAGILEEAGYDVFFYDGQAEGWGKDDTIEHIKNIDPRILVILVNLPTLSEDLSLIGEIKKNIKSLKIITVGTVCRIFPQIILDTDDVDFVSIGDPEGTIKHLVGCLHSNRDVSAISGLAYKIDSKIKFTSLDKLMVDIDELPMIPYHLLPMEKYKGQYFAKGKNIAPIISSRGCPFKCSYYCPYPIGYGSQVRFRSPKKVVAEIETLVKKYRIKNLIFRDQNFTINSEHAKKICQGIVDKGLSINWVCETRLSLMGDMNLLKLMREAGCTQINFGLESGDPELFEKIGKPGTTYNQIEEATKDVKEAGIKAHAHIIIGLPGETWKTIRNTCQLLRVCPFDSVNFSIMTAYPGTRFYEEAKEKKYILTDDISKYSHTNVVVRTESMSGLELKLAQLYLNHRFGHTSLMSNLCSKIIRNSKKIGHKLRHTMVGDVSS